MPLIMTHGWPGSVIELLDVIDPLTNPTAHGGTVASGRAPGRCYWGAPATGRAWFRRTPGSGRSGRGQGAPHATASRVALKSGRVSPDLRRMHASHRGRSTIRAATRAARCGMAGQIFDEPTPLVKQGFGGAG